MGTVGSSTNRFTQLTNVVVVVAALIVVARPSGGFRAAYEARRDRAALLEAAGDHWESLVSEGGRLGSRNSSRIIVEYSDYQCPYCRRAHLTLDSILADQPNVAVVYRHVPLERVHPMATPAARASICSEEQGRFAALHSVLFENEQWQEGADWLEVARLAGIPDTAAFTSCLTAQRTTERLDRDKALADALGIRGTPTWISTTDVLIGADPVAMKDLFER